MERIIKTVICGAKGIMLYVKLDKDGKKKFFVVDANQPGNIGGQEISAKEFEQQIEKHGHIVFYLSGNAKYRALIVEGLDLSWEPLFDLFLFENKVETIFKTIVGLSKDIEYYNLVEIEKAFYNSPGLLVSVRNKLEYWREDNVLSTAVATQAEKICCEHGYIKLLHLIENLSDKTLV